MTYYDYRWATGHNVALASLVNVESDLASYVPGAKGIAINSQPVMTFSQERESLDGYMIQDGLLMARWNIVTLEREGIRYIEDTYMTAGESKAITIYTRQQNQDTYTRYNAYLKPFNPSQDYEYRFGRFENIVLTFTNLTTPS